MEHTCVDVLCICIIPVESCECPSDPMAGVADLARIFRDRRGALRGMGTGFEVSDIEGLLRLDGHHGRDGMTDLGGFFRVTRG